MNCQVGTKYGSFYRRALSREAAWLCLEWRGLIQHGLTRYIHTNYIEIQQGNFSIRNEFRRPRTFLMMAGF